MHGDSKDMGQHAVFPCMHACVLQVALTAFYHTPSAGPFAATFFNRTIDITEVPPLVDLQGLFLLIAGLGLLGSLGRVLRPLLESPSLLSPFSHDWLALRGPVAEGRPC